MEAALPTILASVLAAALISVLGYLGVRRTLEAQERLHSLTRHEEAERLLRRYRDPLVRAAFDLQSRLYNIAVNDFLKHLRGTLAEYEYARESTLQVIGEYFCWVEIMRREVQFLDLREFARNRALSERLDALNHVFLSEGPDPVLRAFRGEQRAIGEVMMSDPAVGRRDIARSSSVRRSNLSYALVCVIEDADILPDPENVSFALPGSSMPLLPIDFWIWNTSTFLRRVGGRLRWLGYAPFRRAGLALIQ